MIRYILLFVFIGFVQTLLTVCLGPLVSSILYFPGLDTNSNFTPSGHAIIRTTLLANPKV